MSTAISGLSLRSPAKLNLMLHITGRRTDGYHELQTVFQFIDLCDELDFELNPNGAIRRLSGNEQVAEDQDLVLRAAHLLQQRHKVGAGVDIRIRKQLPMGGGLGGGSSNAATTLMALNRLWQLHLDETELRAIGQQLGADVPVFIFGHSAWAEGVGERLTAIDLPEPWYLVIHPGIFVSTARIFASKDLTRDCHPITIRAFLDGAGNNVCEAVASGLYPEIKQALKWLNPYSPARMTGTGACVFAAFESRQAADDVLRKMPNQWSGFVARGLNVNPVKGICLGR
jgi:4-diphosphocytidyl-2-C-methyl-D-erythritol kinase